MHILDMGGITINTGQASGVMFFGMLSVFADFERRTISERITEALRGRKSNALPYGKTPYGLTAVGGKGKMGGKGGKLVLSEEETAVISQMRELRGSGLGYHAIAKQLNRTGIKSKQGREWHPYSVSRILEANA